MGEDGISYQLDLLRFSIIYWLQSCRVSVRTVGKVRGEVLHLLGEGRTADAYWPCYLTICVRDVKSKDLHKNCTKQSKEAPIPSKTNIPF